MEGEKYNLGKAQEEADKLRKKVESGEVSSYADAEKLVEKEAGNPREKILSAINQIAYKPEVVLQNNEILDDPQKFNRYLLETLFGKAQLLKSRESFEYIRDHLDEFRGIGVWPEGEIPYQVVWILDSVAESKGSMAEVVEVLTNVYSLTEDQTKKIVVDQYARYCDSYFNKADTILSALKKELPLDEEGRSSVAKSWLSHKLESSTKSYLERKDGKLDISRYGTVQKNLAIEADLLNDQEIIKRGQGLVRAMLLHVGYEKGKRNHPEVMPEIIQLYKRAPLFFEGSFDVEIETLFNCVITYGSFSRAESGYSNYDEQTFEIFKIFGYNPEKTKTLIKNTLVEHLSSAHILEGLIEKYVKGTEFADLLQDGDVVQAGNTGRKVALENLSPVIFSKISEMFNFPTDWPANPEDVVLVKKGILNKIEKLYNIQEISRIQNEFGDAIIINDPEIRSAIEKAVLEDPKPWSRIGEHWTETRDIFNTWNFPIDKLQEYAKGFVVDKLSTPSSYEIHKFIWTEKCLTAFPEILDLPEINDLASSKILEWKYQKESYGYRELNSAIEDIGKAIKLYKLSPELLDQWKTKVVAIELADIKDKEQLKKFRELLKHLKGSPEGLTGSVNDFYLKALSGGDLKQTSFLAESFSIDPKNISVIELQEAGKVGMGEILKQANLENAVKVQELCHLPPEFFEQPEMQSKICQLLSDQFLGSKNIEDFKGKTNLFGIPMDLPLFNDAFAVANIFLRINMGELGGQEFNLENLSESDLRRLFVLVKEKSNEWQDEQTIADPFQAGAETFGYKRMLEYIKRDGLSLHDSVHAFRDILELFRASGLGESEFYGQVLQQVIMDDRGYSEGTAHHHLNAIAQTANKNVREVIEGVQEYKEIERLQELAETFSSPQAVFASWINLKRYSELEQLLGQTEVFDELKALKAEGKEALYRYVETLAFHPDSKVNMSAVIQFWRDPESFLAAEASHTPYEVHDRKKPSNYINMPNLDLTASELRDALVEGKMDGLSAFTPLEIRYTIPTEEFKREPLPDLVNKALGSNKKGIEGVARNSKKLFSELGKLLKPHGLSVVDYIQGKVLPEGVDLSRQIENLLFDRDFGMERPMIKTREFVARIGRKSDPEGAIAGDDTVNCMPFGDGKNTVYTFNPNTAQFVVRIVKGDGKERTIAQSVLTKDMDIKTSIPDVITKLQQEGGHLEDILPADILTIAPVYVACDNVEVTPNYSDERHQQIIETIFKDFFREYMSRYATKEGLNSEKIPIGQGYTDALSQLPSEANTFAPQAPVSYSDKTGANVCMLDLTNEKGLDLIWQKTIKESEVKKQTEAPLPSIKGLGYLSFEDTLKVAYLEGKAYSDNQSLMQFLFNVENGLIAKDINNSAKNRSNMSLKYNDDGGRMRGYLLAWEGRLTDENVEYNAGEFFNQPCIYIIDVASDKENRMAGGRLIQGFSELYKQNYLDKGNAMPIYAQARETTSYQIVKRQLDKLGKNAGFNFELVELPTYEVGDDVMHPIIIRPISIRT